MLDGVSAELLNVNKMVETLGDKGYPVEMGVFVQKQLAPLETVSEELRVLYGASSAKSWQGEPLSDLQDAIDTMEVKTKELDTIFTAAKKGQMKDLKKICGQSA